MDAASTGEITQLLLAWNNGDTAALEQLTPLVHSELHRLAKRYMAGERPDHILQTTALVNEAYIQLIDWKNVQWQNRAHFFGLAAQIMRHILVNFARAQRREKRGAGAVRISLSEVATSLKSSAPIWWRLMTPCKSWSGWTRDRLAWWSCDFSPV